MAIILKVLILKKLKNNKPMYTEECILRNPNMQDIRMLSEFGYKALEGGVKCRKPKKYLYVKNGFWKFTDTAFKKAIDCGENRQMFHGIVAISTTTILEQWLTDGENWIWLKCSDYPNLLNGVNIDSLNKVGGGNYHKATAKEIIEHFKK